MRKLLFIAALVLFQAPSFAQIGKLNVGKLQGAVSGGNKVTAGNIDVIIDSQNSNQTLPEGTQTFVYRCYLNPEVGNIKKVLGVNDFAYQLTVQ